MITRLFFLLVLFISCGSKVLLLHAQNLGGYIYAADNGEALVAATVYYLHEPSTGCLTNEKGFFSLPARSERDSIVVAYLGYKNWLGVTIGSEELQISLQPLVHTAANVVVTAERRPAQIFATQQLKRLDVYLNAAAKADVLLAVNSMAAATNPDETANVSLRGSPSEATGIFFNNILLKDVVRLDQPNGAGQFSIFNTAIVNGLDIYPSNPPLYLGQAASGAISIRTTEELKGTTKAVSLHMAGGGFQTSFLVSKKTGLLLYANHANQNWLKAANPEALRDLERFVSTDIGLFLTHQFSERAKLILFNLSIFERYDFRLQEGRFRGLFHQHKNRNQTTLNYIYQASNWRLSWNHGFNTSVADYETGNIATHLNLLDYSSNLLWHWQSGSWNGTTALHYNLSNNKANGSYPIYAGAWEAEDPASTFQSDARNRLPELAAFAKRQWGSQNTLGFGFRSAYDYISKQWLYGVQANWHRQLSKQQVLILSGGRYYQLWPARQAQTGTAFNRSYQLALDWKWTPKNWEVNLSVYRHWANWQGQENPIFGQEATISYKSYPLQTNLSFSRVSSRLKIDNTNSYPGQFDFAYLARWQMQYVLPGQVTWNAALNWREGRYYQPLIDRQWNNELNDWTPLYSSPAEGERLPDYLRLDTGLSRQFLIGDGVLIAFLNVNNTLNTYNVRTYAYDHLYQQATALHYSKLVWFIGGVYQW